MGTVVKPMNRDGLLDIIFTHPRLLAVVRHVLGLHLKYIGSNYHCAMPGYGRQGIHADFVWGVKGEPQVVNAVWLIDEFTQENGATRVVPGSRCRSVVSGKALALRWSSESYAEHFSYVCGAKSAEGGTPTWVLLGGLFFLAASAEAPPEPPDYYCESGVRDSSGQCCAVGEEVVGGVCTLSATIPGDAIGDFCADPGNWNHPACGGAGGGGDDDGGDEGGGGSPCHSAGCGDGDENEPDSEWEDAADDMGDCIRDKVPDMSDAEIEEAFRITDDKLRIQWETVDNDEGAAYRIVATKNSDGEYTGVSAYIVLLDYNKLHDQTRSPYLRSRDSVLYKKISHEYVHIWKFAKTKGEEDWSGHGGAFHQTLGSFRVRSTSCE